MAITTGGIFDTTGADNLVAGDFPGLVAKVFELKDKGIIERGTVLGRGADGKYFVLGATQESETEGEDPVAIDGPAAAIVADTTTEDDDYVTAYVSGLFYRNLLLVADGYELTEEDEYNLRLGGILLTDGI